MTRSIPFERVALLLQGGGALGAYQAGVFQAMAQAGVQPDCVTGVSIGAINAALIAGNAPDDRVKALRAFWDRVTAPPFGFPYIRSWLGFLESAGDNAHMTVGGAHAFVSAIGGAPGFFRPRPVPPAFAPTGTPAAESFYDTTPLKATLEDLVDFDRINSGETWFGVGAVNVRNGNLEWFDNTERQIRPEHVMASGALPPGFAAVEIDGEYYWDGGLVSNTPLDRILESNSRKDTLAFQVDLWSAEGPLPRSIFDLDLREKDIRFSSRTRASTDHFRYAQRVRRSIHRLLEKMADLSVLDPEDLDLLRRGADQKSYSLVHLIYRAKSYEGSFKDYEFSRGSMEEHWDVGLQDARRALKRREIYDLPTSPDGVSVFDFNPHQKEKP